MVWHLARATVILPIQPSHRVGEQACRVGRIQEAAWDVPMSKFFQAPVQLTLNSKNIKGTLIPVHIIYAYMSVNNNE